jgi:hypothetical protein
MTTEVLSRDVVKTIAGVEAVMETSTDYPFITATHHQKYRWTAT